ncbi:terminase gpA endonuclease subunit [Sulfitobacter sp. M22]|uniref:terminase gpA endonuclease subunit n=1 Tax=Sulfitobacter sp. M22 TaxID=2675332 RepID=UPI001F3DA82C|nr:terminase gpA endonuclease subunit [Sulfitobacter sp. M22]
MSLEMFSFTTDREIAAYEQSHSRRGIYAKGRENFCESLNSMLSLVMPKEKMLPSEWAEKHGLIDPMNPAAGTVKLYGYQKELLDVMVDPDVDQVSVLKAARVGATKLMTLGIGYFIEQSPRSVMLAQPTVGDAEDFSGSELMPMFSNTPSLKALRRTVKRGEKQDTQTDFQFTNGSILRCRGAASDDSFRRIAVSVGFGDEVDADGWSALKKGSQGDKIGLYKNRGETIPDSKFYFASSPTWEHSSVIKREFLKSDQRRYFVPCPHCDEMQYLEFGGRDVDYGLKWKVNEIGTVVDAYYVCKANGCVIEERSKKWMDENGEWRPTATPMDPRHRGYHLWTGMSLFKKAGWKYIAAQAIEAAKDPQKLKVFVNTRLGETYEERKDVKPEISVHEAKSNLENYNALMIPAGVQVLTAGVDVQTGRKKAKKKEHAARVEVSIWGWGYGEESWLISHHLIPGEFSDPNLQRNLDQLLATPIRRVDGSELIIQAAAVDIGGHYTESVKAYCNARTRRNVWAIKGDNRTKGTRSASVWPRTPQRHKHGQFFFLDTQLAKDIIFRRLNTPDVVHFPLGTEDRYFEGLASEVKLQMGQGYHWDKPNNNAYGESLDCFVYALSALYGLKMFSKRWRHLDNLPVQIDETENKQITNSDAEFNSDETFMRDKDHTPAQAPPPPARKKKRRAVAKSKFLR